MADEVVIPADAGRSAAGLIGAVLDGDLVAVNQRADELLRESPGDTIRALAIAGALMALQTGNLAARCLDGLTETDEAFGDVVHARAKHALWEWSGVIADDPVLGVWPGD